MTSEMTSEILSAINILTKPLGGEFRSEIRIHPISNLILIRFSRGSVRSSSLSISEVCFCSASTVFTHAGLRSGL